MGRKVVEPEHFVYIVMTKSSPEGSYKYNSDFPTFEGAKGRANQLSGPVKIIRARAATVLRFLKRSEKL